MLCIKCIIFYNESKDEDTTINYDFYWKHKDKIDRLKYMREDIKSDEVDDVQETASEQEVKEESVVEVKLSEIEIEEDTKQPLVA